MGEHGMEGIQETFHDGHIIHYSVRLPNFGNTLPLNYERSFYFHCPVSSTSFMFRVTFQRAPNERGVDCVVLISRTDYIGIRVDVQFLMSAITPLYGVRVPPRDIILDRMPPFHQATRPVLAFIPNDILTQLGDRYVQFEASLGVRGCHRERDTERSSRRPGPPPVPEKHKFLAKM